MKALSPVPTKSVRSMTKDLDSTNDWIVAMRLSSFHDMDLQWVAPMAINTSRMIRRMCGGEFASLRRQSVSIRVVLGRSGRRAGTLTAAVGHAYTPVRPCLHTRQRATANLVASRARRRLTGPRGEGLEPNGPQRAPGS